MTPERWQGRLQRLQAHGRLPSVVGGVALGGETAWAGGAGEVPGPAPANVGYRIGSITKTMTAAAVVALTVDGAVDLDDPVGRFVPECGRPDATLRALLSHTAGLASEPAGPWWERSPGVDVDTMLQRDDGARAVYEPGTPAPDGGWYHYSNLGYGLLGEVVARVRGVSWWDVVHDTLLRPLRMGRTTWAAAAPHAPGRSVDHFAGTLTEEPHHDTGAMAPAGQLWSTLADLLVWADALAGGRPDVLPESVLGPMRDAATPDGGYGLGLRRLEAEGRTWVGHTGSMPGFLASLFVDPVSRDAVVVLANATVGLPTASVPALLLDDSTELRVDGGSPSAWTPTTEVPSEVADLLGVWFWGNTALGWHWEDGGLVVRDLRTAEVAHRFALHADAGPGRQLLGTHGYHRGEPLRVGRADDGTPVALEVATFVHTRAPYGGEG